MQRIGFVLLRCQEYAIWMGVQAPATPQATCPFRVFIHFFSKDSDL